MSKSIPSNVAAFISEKMDAGMDPDMIKVGLVTDFALSFNKAGAVFALYLKENGLQTRRVGFTAMFHDFLKEGVKTEAECLKFMKDYGSQNTWNHRKMYLAQMELTNSIWEAK